MRNGLIDFPGEFRPFCRKGKNHNMATAFTRTFREAGRQSGRGTVFQLAAIAAGLAGWGMWSAMAPIGIYETTATARLEADLAASQVQPAVDGRVMEWAMVVGREVKAGDILVRLDDGRPRLEVQEHRAAISAIQEEMAGFVSQAKAEELARTEERGVALATADEARANTREAQAPARFNTAELGRLRQLREQGLISEREYQKGAAESERSQATLDRGSVTVIRIEREQHARDRERDTRLRRAETELARLEGDIQRHMAAIEVLEHEIARHVVRAPVAGRIGEAATLRSGSVVRAGERLGAVVPSGEIQIVAQFPVSAMGRLRPGQTAVMRMDGFPWMQYGTVRASVRRVAGEVRDGTVRVELALADERPAGIPMSHGLPGTLEVEVEKATPAELVMRNAGRVLARPRVNDTLAMAR